MYVITFIMLIILSVILTDLGKMKEHNRKIIDQNEQMIGLLEDIRDRSKRGD